MRTAKSGGSGKIGRSRDKCAKYRLEHKKEKSKIKKWRKLIKKLLPNNPSRQELEKRIKQVENKINV